jgi:predicted regulator of Ras-like GTPase activity (Roadblock/LC7/MglB family)
MNINDVLQLPTMGLRTGELRIEHGAHVAQLFYEEGQVVHVVLGDQVDEEALVELQGWTAGDFVFQQGIDPPKHTIEEDLHRLLMRCAKRRDERQRTGARSGAVALGSPEVAKALGDALATHQGFNVMAFVSRTGEVLGVAPQNAPTDGAVAVAATCFEVAAKAPRSEVKRCWIEDQEGHALWLRLGAEVSFVILSKPSVPLGSTMLAASKVGASLKGMLGGNGV